MKSLVKYIYEKLIINQRFDEKLIINKDSKIVGANDDVLMDLINAHFKKYMSIYYEMLFKSSIKASLETSLGDHGIANDFDKVDEFMKLNDKMQKYKVIYRYVYDPKNSNAEYRALSDKIDELFDAININDIELKEMWRSTKNNYSVKYYECIDFIFLWLGSSNFGYVYIAMN